MDTTLMMEPASAPAEPDAMEAPAAEEMPVAPAPATRRVRRIWNVGVVLAIVLIGVALCLADRQFLAAGNLQNNLLIPLSWLAILSVGVTLVFIAGGVDLSAAGVFVLAGAASASVLRHVAADAPAWPSFRGIVDAISAGHFPATSLFGVYICGFGAPLLVGLLCGVINGLLVVGLRVHSAVVTLATLWIFRSLAGGYASEWATGGVAQVIVREWSFKGVAIRPAPMLICLACVACAWVFLTRCIAGRQLYAVGGNPVAARFSGVRVGRTRIRAFALSGLLAGLAACLACGTQAKIQSGYELTVVAAALVGGASIRGGRGTAPGALLGAVVMQLLLVATIHLKNVLLGIPGAQSHLPTFSLSEKHAVAFAGLAILIAMAFDRRRSTTATSHD